MLDNSLGIPEATEWHVQAAVALRRSFRERGVWEALKAGSRHISLNQIDQTAVLLRTLGFTEGKLHIYHLHDHVPSILGLVFGGQNGN